MKQLRLTVICFFIILSLPAQIPSLQWARNIGGSRGDEIKVDAAGNVYTTGYFAGAGDFDPGPGNYFLNAFGIADDAYISKLDANGNFLWAIQLGGSSTNYSFSIEVDAAGNVYSVGYFSGTVDFDPGPGVFELTTNGQFDIGISKLDANGNFVWAKKVGGANSDLAYSLILDQTDNICITGNFIGVVDFDPGPAIANLDGNGTLGECFILKLTAGGDFIWAKEIDGNYSVGSTISKDATGSLYVCGVYNLTADLDPGVGVYNVTSADAGTDAFVIKLDASGGFVWGRSFGGPGTQTCESVETDASGNVYLAGYFPFTVDFDPGVGIFEMTATGSSDAFVLKLDASGNFVWAKAFSGTAAENANDLAVDALGNVYVTGLFQATTDFDPGAGVFNLTTISNDVYVAKLDAAGNFGWALQFSTGFSNTGLSIFVRSNGNIYTTGQFQGSGDFDPGPGTTALNSANGRTYIVNLGSSVLPLTLLEFSGSSIASGNILQWKTAQEINTKDFEIEWSNNGINFEKIAARKSAGNSNATKQYSYLHTTRVNGDNYYRLKMQDIDGRFTYSNIIKINTKITVADFSVFPNPVSNVLQLNIQSLKTETLLFRLLGADGKIIASKYFNVVKGSNLFNWNLRSIPAGTYFITALNEQFKTLQVIKN